MVGVIHLTRLVLIGTRLVILIDLTGLALRVVIHVDLAGLALRTDLIGLVELGLAEVAKLSLVATLAGLHLIADLVGGSQFPCLLRGSAGRGNQQAKGCDKRHERRIPEVLHGHRDAGARLQDTGGFLVICVISYGHYKARVD